MGEHRAHALRSPGYGVPMLRRTSPVRRLLIWAMRHPNSPHVSTNFAVEFSPALAYLEQLNRSEGPRVTVNHLFAAAVGVPTQSFPRPTRASWAAASDASSGWEWRRR